MIESELPAIVSTLNSLWFLRISATLLSYASPLKPHYRNNYTVMSFSLAAEPQPLSPSPVSNMSFGRHLTLADAFHDSPEHAKLLFSSSHIPNTWVSLARRFPAHVTLTVCAPATTFCIPDSHSSCVAQADGTSQGYEIYLFLETVELYPLAYS